MLWKFALCLWFAFAFLCGQSISINAASRDPVSLSQYGLPQEVLEAGESPIKLMEAAKPYFGDPISAAERRKWIPKCNSEQSGHECGKAVDGVPGTFWQTKADTAGKKKPDPLPHIITIDLQAVENVTAISMTPRFDAHLGGAVAAHKVYLSSDNVTWNDPVAVGTWFADSAGKILIVAEIARKKIGLTSFAVKFAVFEPKQVQFVRLQASATIATQSISIVNLDVWVNKTFTETSPSLGRWGPTIDFPLVPVGVFVDPIFGNVITFSSHNHDGIDNPAFAGTTFTATWNRTSGIVSEMRVKNTEHDMFCPGMSFDVNGRMIVTGGQSSDKTSIYNSTSGNWIKGPEMNTPRGYQGSTTCANGHVFVIGGSWSGGPAGNRNGEIYDPNPKTTKNWTSLDGCRAEPIQTDDWDKGYRADNHVWLLGWKKNSVFQAGPSKNMHWITTTGKGDIKPAGLRGNTTFVDSDAMCGVAAMYNATEGKILTAGGAPSYKYKNDAGLIKGNKSTNNAFIITLNKVNDKVNVRIAGGGMKYSRTFHHAVILPSGDTFVVGGQVEGTPWSEDTPQFEPEIYSPIGDKWTSVARHSIVRVYHSFGLLLPDATILVGGGGLCNCSTNHFDAQIYTPAYLLTPKGDLATRPVITKISAATVRPGASLTVTTDSDVVGASLIRYSGATHSVNNDQRRIELKLQKSRKGFQYGVTIPRDGGIAIPGYWMLFVMNAAKVPSEAKNVQILVARG